MNAYCLIFPQADKTEVQRQHHRAGATQPAPRRLGN